VSLEAESFTVFDFASGAEFLKLARLEKQRCLLLEVHMPGMSGLEVLEHIRRDNSDIPVMLMTGCPSSAIENAAACADTALIEKPFRPGELLDAIKRTLRGSSLP
jgi:FixJ family two-component response regulator